MPTKWQQVQPQFGNVPGMDPDVEWALGPGRPWYFLPGRQDYWIPVLLRLEKTTPLEFAQGTGFIDPTQNSTWLKTIFIAKFYLTRTAKSGYCPALVTKDFFMFMRTNPDLRERVPRLRLGLPLDGRSLPSKP